MSETKIDSVVIGCNDRNFEAFANKQREMKEWSGAYHEVKANSVLIDGKRMTYMELLNRVIKKATGKDPRLSAFEVPSLGVCYLNNFLQERGFKTEVVNFLNYGKNELIDLLLQSPLSVAITTTYYIENEPIVEIVRFIRKYSPRSRIIVGGPHIYNLFCDYEDEALEFNLENIGADIYITDAQGELTLSRTLECLREERENDLGAVPNLIYRLDDGTYQKTHREEENNDLDENIIHWDKFQRSLVVPTAYVRTARSCPFACTFCNFPTMAGKHVVSDIASVEYELKALHRMGTKYIIFVDDTFNVPLPRFKNILRMMIREQFNFHWIAFLRCGNADEEALDLMEESGCLGVFLGVESGDQTILNYMNKGVKLDRYRWGIDGLKKRGIITFMSIICGFPGETTETVKNTIDFVEETAPTFFNVQLYYHDIRAPIHKKAEEFAIRGAGYNWQHRTMNWQKAADWSSYMFKNIHNSIPLTLYGFSLWSMPYLMSKGITVKQIKKFGKITRGLFALNLDDIEGDSAEYERELISMLRNSGVDGTSGIEIASDRPSLQYVA